MNTLFHELLLVSLGKLSRMSYAPSGAEWKQLYKEAEKQALVGILFSGIERINENDTQRSCYDNDKADLNIPMDVLMRWIGRAEQIRQQNELVNRRAAEVIRLFAEGGFRSVVLKGQGVAQLYKINDNDTQESCYDNDDWDNKQKLSSITHELSEATLNADLRTPGDIDLWVDGKREDVIRFMKQKGWAVGQTVVHHSDVKIFPDIETEIHYYPSYTFSPLRWRKYKQWFREQRAAVFGTNTEITDHTDSDDKHKLSLIDHKLSEVNIGELGFNYPGIAFNLVYSLLHIFRHVFHEGIGLRQLLDYYFILQHSTEAERQEAIQTLRWMGLERFAAAVMYVELTVFGNSARGAKDNDTQQSCYDNDNVNHNFNDNLNPNIPLELLCEPDKEAGQFLLDEILKYGNFGKYNEATRRAHQRGSFGLYLHNVARLMKMVHYYPTEVLWAPFWKIGHFVWRKTKGY